MVTATITVTVVVTVTTGTLTVGGNGDGKVNDKRVARRCSTYTSLMEFPCPLILSPHARGPSQAPADRGVPPERRCTEHGRAGIPLL